jgi:hypothetical protein
MWWDSMAEWILNLSLLALSVTILVGVILVLYSSIVDREEHPDERHNRAAEREEQWYPLR